MANDLMIDKISLFQLFPLKSYKKVFYKSSIFNIDNTNDYVFPK